MPLEKNKKISLIHKENKNNDKVQTDTSLQEVPQSILLSGSLTVEAALVFPLFLFALVTILFFFRVLQINKLTWDALAATGSRMSLELGAEEDSLLKASLYFHKELLKENLPDTFLVGGRAGIGWSGTRLDGEYVDLCIRYKCRLPVSLFGVGNIPISQRVRMKKWTGSSGNWGEQANEQVVYITPNGSVYHLTKDCSHLRLSTKIMEKEAVKASGYTACLLCGMEQGLYSFYYVTDEGRKYHTRLSCSGLKRTIYVVRLSEAGDRAVCSRCGGG